MAFRIRQSRIPNQAADSRPLTGAAERRFLRLFYTRHFELNGVFIPMRIDWWHRVFESKAMYEWLPLRLLIFGLLVGGGALFALAGIAFDKWRERRARDSAAREGGVVTAQYPANLTHLYRRRERGPSARTAHKGGGSPAEYRGTLTHFSGPRSAAR
jgi:hypothetical protein